MQIAIDGVPAAKPSKTGVEWYVYHLLKTMNALRPELEVVVYTHRPLDWELQGHWRNEVIAWPFPGWKRIWGLYLWAHRPQLVFAPGDALPPWRGRQVMTIHDLAFFVSPDLYTPSERAKLTAGYARAARLATCIAVSETTKQDFVRAYGVPAEQVTVVPLAVDAAYRPVAQEHQDAVRAQYLLPASYFVHVGRLDARKGIGELIPIFVRWRASHPDTELVLVGRPGEGSVAIQALAQQPGVRMLGWLDTPEVVAILAGARALVFPTKKEGFGMPILEAMAVGTPVVCSDLPVLREVGRDVPLFVERTEEAAWHRAFDQVCEEDMADRIARGQTHAACFTWEATAQKTLDVLCDTL